jgi:hypothetical protein
VFFTDRRAGRNVGFLEFVYVLGALGAKEHDTTQAEHTFVWRLLDLEDAGSLSRVGPQPHVVACLLLRSEQEELDLKMHVLRALFCSQAEMIQRLKSVLTHTQVRKRNHVVPITECTSLRS